MASYSWCTDVHLDFLRNDDKRLIDFATSLVSSNPTGVVITGDISVAGSLVYHLSAIERVVQRPIYYVLGNHDYYGNNVENVRKAMHELTNISPFLRYMPTMAYFAATPATAIVGHDGWYDALYGDYAKSTFGMTDWTAIHDFLPLNGSKSQIVGLARKLAHEGVTHVMTGIKSAVRYHKNVVVLTHFPPFPQAHVHNGVQGDDNAMPWYVSRMMGDMLNQAADTFPAVNFTVLSGHTHGAYEGQLKKNLLVKVGGAEYGHPVLQGVIQVP